MERLRLRVNKSRATCVDELNDGVEGLELRLKRLGIDTSGAVIDEDGEAKGKPPSGNVSMKYNSSTIQYNTI